MERDTKETIWMLAIVFLLFLLAICFMTSCRSIKYVPVQSTRTDTLYKVRLQHDTLSTLDSVYFETFVKGDTVFRNRDRWKVMYKAVLKVDTVNRAKTDSVRVPYPVETIKTVNRLHWWQKVLMWFGAVFIGVMGFNVFMFIKRKTL